MERSYLMTVWVQLPTKLVKDSSVLASSGRRDLKGRVEWDHAQWRQKGAMG